MEKQATIDQSIKITPLPFKVVAVPKDNVHHLLDTASDSLHMPVNVKIKIRNTAAKGIQHDIVSISKFTNAKKIRLVNSDQTIMSFDIFLEAEKIKKHQKKSQNKFLQLLKTGGCLSIQTDDDAFNYMPGSSYSSNKLENTSNVINTQKHKRAEKFSLKKSLTLVDSVDDAPNIPKSFLGKCKRGGCLDPPFSEDKYIYKPQLKELPFKQESIEDVTNIAERIQDALEIEQKAKDLSNSIIEEIYSNSLITYPNLSSSEIEIQEENQKKKLRNRIASENKERRSVNEFSKTYFMPSRRAISKTSYKSNDERIVSRHSKNEINSNELNNTKAEDSAALILSTKNILLTNQIEPNQTTETADYERNNEILKSVEEQVSQSIIIPEITSESANRHITSPLIIDNTELSTITDKYIDKENIFLNNNKENIEQTLTKTSLDVALENKIIQSNNETKFDIDKLKAPKISPLTNMNNALNIEDEPRVSEQKQSKDSGPILSNILCISERTNFIKDDSVISNSLTNPKPDHSAPDNFQIKYSETEISTKKDIKDCKLNDFRYSDDNILESSGSMKFANEFALTSKKNPILDNETSLLPKDFTTVLLNNHDTTAKNYIREDNDPTQSRDNLISQLKYNNNSFNNKGPKITTSIENMAMESDKYINKQELLFNLRSEDSAVLNSQVDEYNLLLKEKSVTISHEENKLFPTKDLDNIDNTLYDTNAFFRNEADDKLAGGHNVLSASDTDFNNRYDKHLNSIEEFTNADVKDDQFKINEKTSSNFKRYNDNISFNTIVGENIPTFISQNNSSKNSLLNAKDDKNKYRSIGNSRTTTDMNPSSTLTEQTAIIELEDNLIMNNTMKENILFNSIIHQIVEKTSKEILDNKIDAQNSIERQIFQSKAQSQLPNEGVISFSSENIGSPYNDLSTLDTIASTQINELVDSISESDSFADNISNKQKTIKNDNDLLISMALIDNGNDKNKSKIKGLNETKLSNRNSLITVNLGFHSFVNDNNEIEINTFDPSKDLEHYPQDNVTIVKSILRRNDEAFRVPVNSKMDVTIQIEPVNIFRKGNVPAKYFSVSEGNLLDKSAEVSVHTDVMIQETLNSVYETLIPVKMIIQDLIQEADLLTRQQQLFKEMLNTTSKTSRLIPTNKTCTCIKKAI